jgi:DNA mismatch repair protein MutH
MSDFTGESVGRLRQRVSSSYPGDQTRDKGWKGMVDWLGN